MLTALDASSLDAIDGSLKLLVSVSVGTAKSGRKHKVVDDRPREGGVER